MRVSRARVQTFFADVLGLRVSLGALSAMDKRISRQLEPSYKQLQQAIQTSELKRCDETTWYQDGKRRVWWTATDGKVALLRITSHRDTLSLKAFISEEVQGVIISKRYSAYRFMKQTQRQLCWAHLLRDFESMSE
jgi:transposase